MNLLTAIVLLVIGLVILWKAADFLVSGAVNLASRLGISPLVIGLTIVAMGTSAPEVAASITAAVHGAGDIAVGNVFGSNIANLALVGGLCAMLRPMTVRIETLQKELPVMVAVAMLLFPVIHSLTVTREEGIILLVLFGAMLAATVWQAKKQIEQKPGIEAEIREEIETVGAVKAQQLWVSVVFIIAALAGLAVGADITLRGAVVIGAKAGLSDAVIGMTIVAVGTSLPELATSLVAVLKKQDDISIGNLVGSNIFNTLLVVGVAGTVRPLNINARLAGADYWIMVAVSFAFMIMAIFGKRISRRDGIILFCMYVGYIVYLLTYPEIIKN